MTEDMRSVRSKLVAIGGSFDSIPEYGEPNKPAALTQKLGIAIRQRLFGDTISQQMKSLQKKANRIVEKEQAQKLKRKPTSRFSSKVNSMVNSRQQSLRDVTQFVSNLKAKEVSSDEECCVEEPAEVSPFIKHAKGEVQLTSPTFGDTIRIKSPTVKFGTSKASMKDLQHVEMQISEFQGLPDFGYGTDNYILDQLDKSESKWKVLGELLGDNTKFAWLMNYIQLSKLEQQVTNAEEQERVIQEKRRQIIENKRVLQMEEEQFKSGGQAEKEQSDKTVRIARKEYQSLVQSLTSSQDTLRMFKNSYKRNLISPENLRTDPKDERKVGKPRFVRKLDPQQVSPHEQRQKKVNLLKHLNSNLEALKFDQKQSMLKPVERNRLFEMEAKTKQLIDAVKSNKTSPERSTDLETINSSLASLTQQSGFKNGKAKLGSHQRDLRQAAQMAIEINDSPKTRVTQKQSKDALPSLPKAASPRHGNTTLSPLQSLQTTSKRFSPKFQFATSRSRNFQPHDNDQNYKPVKGSQNISLISSQDTTTAQAQTQRSINFGCGFENLKKFKPPQLTLSEVMHKAVIRRGSKNQTEFQESNNHNQSPIREVITPLSSPRQRTSRLSIVKPLSDKRALSPHKSGTIQLKAQHQRMRRDSVSESFQTSSATSFRSSAMSDNSPTQTRKRNPINLVKGGEYSKTFQNPSPMLKLIRKVEN